MIAKVPFFFLTIEMEDGRGEKLMEKKGLQSYLSNIQHVCKAIVPV